MSTDASTVEKRTDAEPPRHDGQPDDCRPTTPVHEPARRSSDRDGSQLRTSTADAEAADTEAAAKGVTP